jgi:hypothetical protein
MDSGVKFNLKHDASFDESAVSTDGIGNITDMPLLRDKPCFGRPERFVRGSYDSALAPFTGRNRTAEWRHSRCQRCPVMRACSGVVAERIETAPQVNTAFLAFAEATDGLMESAMFDRGIGKRRWIAFQLAIEKHGGWVSVNDERVAADDVRREQQRKNDDAATKRAKRAQVRAARLGKAQVMTPEFRAAAEVERDRRRDVLIRLRQQPVAPRWITRMPPESCERTADVWFARTMLKRAGEKITGKAVAAWLATQGRDQCMNPASLVARFYEDSARIEKLESDEAGAPIWKLFEG